MAGTDTYNADWYPGDQYVDVVGLDIYADPTANLSGNFTSIKTPFDGKKLLALTETGNLPDPDKIRGFATWWSWFSVWTGTDYIRKQPIETLKAVYNDKDVITRDELPNWRTYGRFQMAAPAYNCQTGALTFQTTGGDGTPVEFFAVGITSWTTNPNQVIDPIIRRDGDPLTLMARQSGQVVSMPFDFRAFCGNQGANQPPVFHGPTTPQSATVGTAFSYQIPATTFTDPENGALTMTATNLPAGLSLSAATRTISGTPTAAGSYVVTLTVADPQNAATTGTLTINVTSAGGVQPFAMAAPAYNCQTGALTFQTTGGDGTPVEFFAVGITSWTTNPNQVIDPIIRRDGDPLTLMARQSGQVVSMPFDFRAFCGNQGANQPPVFHGPTTPQSATVGTAFSYQIPATTFTDPENGALTMTATNLPAGLSLSAATRTISGTPTAAGSYVVTLTVADPQNAATTGTLTINVTSAGGVQPFAMAAPAYNCQTGALTFQTTGGNGTPVEYFAAGLTVWTTNPNQVIDPIIRRDGDPLTLMARQSGRVVSMPFDFRGYCSANGRIAAEETLMQVRVLGNPVDEQVTVEITGAAGQALQLSLTDISGRVVEHRTVGQAIVAERQVFDLRRQPTGMLLLSVSREGQTERVKLIKQ